MQQNNMTSIRELLEQMPTQQLDAMLQAELTKEHIDENSVRLILHVLREREKDDPVEITPQIEQAWEKYRQDTQALEKRALRPAKVRRWLLRAASAAAVLLLLVSVVPQQAEAESIWEKLARWTDSIFSFFDPGEEEFSQETYEFRTDNPGLQQVYDAVVELGVTEPVVPMWLPEGYELVECKTGIMPRQEYVYARLSNGTDKIVYKITSYSADVRYEYTKDKSQVDILEQYGITYNIMHNNEMWVVVWVKDNIECSLFVDCQEDILYEILESIYRWRKSE